MKILIDGKIKQVEISITMYFKVVKIILYDKILYGKEVQISVFSPA